MMAVVPDENDERNEIVDEREPPEMVVKLDVPDGVTLRLLVNGVRIDLDD
jgi:hypothetical protein